MPEEMVSAQEKKIRTPDKKRKLISKSDAEKALPAPDDGTPYFILEETTPGFGLRVGARTKSWVVRRKFMGMTRRLTIGSYPVLMPDEARKKAKQFLGMMENAVDPKEEIEKRKQEYAAKKTFHSWTLETLWPLYLSKSRENPHSENTKKSYVNGEKRLKGSSFWKVPIATMTADHVRAGYDHLLKTTNSKRSNNGGKTTAAQVMRCARAVLRFGLEKKLGGKYPDPFESIDDDDRWKQPEPKSGTVIDAEGDLARWWASVESLRQKTDPRAADAPTLADYLILSLLWGGRKTEMLTLEWASVDFNAGSVAFEAEKTKSKRRHLIPLAPFARSILERRWQAREKLPAEKRSAYVFQASRTGGKTGVRAHITEPKGRISEVVKDSGVKFSAHDLRRTFGTLLGEIGASYHQTKAAMNHADGGDVTEKHYMRIRLKALAEVFVKLENAILEEAGVKTGAQQPAESITPKELQEFRAWKAAQGGKFSEARH